jgi:ABC-2 type transport system permease protein
MPGLIMMSLLQNAFANSSSSLIQSKITGNIVFVLLPPLSYLEFFLAYLIAALLRGFAVGLGVLLVGLLFTDIEMRHPLWVLVFATASGAVFSCIGIIAGIWADKFDHLAAVTNFVIVPLTFLSGTFYDVKVMIEPFESIAHLNPIFYMIDGYRYGHIGVANGSLQIGLIYTGLLALASTAGVWAMFRNGYKLKA